MNYLFAMGAIALMAAASSACSGNSSSNNPEAAAEAAASSLPTDGILGELPKVVAEFEASEAAADSKYKELKESAPEKANEFWKEYLAQGNRTKFKKETMPALEKTLEGKEIPTEVAEGLPIILDKNFTLDAKRNALTTSAFIAEATNQTPIMSYTSVAYDSDGNPFYIGKKSISFSNYPIAAGKTFTSEFFVSVSDYDAANWAKLAKIVIMDKESEAFKQAEEQVKALKDAFKN